MLMSRSPSSARPLITTHPQPMVVVVERVLFWNDFWKRWRPPIFLPILLLLVAFLLCPPISEARKLDGRELAVGCWNVTVRSKVHYYLDCFDEKLPIPTKHQHPGPKDDKKSLNRGSRHDDAAAAASTGTSIDFFFPPKQQTFTWAVGKENKDIRTWPTEKLALGVDSPFYKGWGKIGSFLNPFRHFSSKTSRSRSRCLDCSLSLFPNGTFVMEPVIRTSQPRSLLQPKQQTYLSDARSFPNPATAESLAMHGRWRLFPNPYCATDRFYDVVQLQSYPRTATIIQTKTKMKPTIIRRTTQEKTIMVRTRQSLLWQSHLMGHYARQPRPHRSGSPTAPASESSPQLSPQPSSSLQSPPARMIKGICLLQQEPLIAENDKADALIAMALEKEYRRRNQKGQKGSGWFQQERRAAKQEPEDRQWNRWYFRMRTRRKRVVAEFTARKWNP
ncbi:hypothetical protein ACA910_006776 [Epithemia clementina (nom. ined.)]